MANKKLNFTSQIGKVYEQKTRLKETIENVERVMKEQKALIEIIEASDRKNEISERFPEDLKDNLVTLETQLALLAIQASCCDSLIEAYETEKRENLHKSKYTTEQLVTLFVTTFDMFNENRNYVEPTAEAEGTTEATTKEESVN